MVTSTATGLIALCGVLVFWVTAAALVDFGLIGAMLTWRVEPHAVFALASINNLRTGLSKFVDADS